MTSCVICQDTEAADMSTLRCGHAFHSPCIITALRVSSLCPICRDRGHDTEGREDALAAITDVLLERFQHQAAHVFFMGSVRDKIKEKAVASRAGRETVQEFQDARTRCKKQTAVIKNLKERKFDDFKKTYYAEETADHAEFRLRKKRLYRAMGQLNKLLRLPEEDWSAFSKYIYEGCGRDARIPINVSF